MDFKEIKALGEKTNRIIEIQGLLSELKILADHSITSDTSSFTLNLTHSCKSVSQPSEHLADSIEEMMKSFLPKGVKAGIMVSSLQRPPHFSVKLKGRFQFAIFDAIRETLLEEQQCLTEEINLKTGKQ